MIKKIFKSLKLLLLTFIFVFNFSFAYSCDLKSFYSPSIIKIIKPGFNKAFLFLFNFNEKKEILIITKKKINLKKSEIREFEFQPENKPSGFKILKNTYVKARVSAGYMMEIAKDFNDAVGVDNSFLEEDPSEDKNKEEPSAEGGIEIRYYF
jgi:hypothetical protein